MYIEQSVEPIPHPINLIPLSFSYLSFLFEKAPELTGHLLRGLFMHPRKGNAKT